MVIQIFPHGFHSQERIHPWRWTSLPKVIYSHLSPFSDATAEYYRLGNSQAVHSYSSGHKQRCHFYVELPHFVVWSPKEEISVRPTTSLRPPCRDKAQPTPQVFQPTVATEVPLTAAMDHKQGQDFERCQTSATACHLLTPLAPEQSSRA